ncbi:MAG TPA: acyltransferase [Puia sp.]|jgi:peptidoglycan/LPS O-acetylase OafA/YrhL
MNRIQPIDGLRAFAVIGVIWAHVWMFFGSQPLFVAGINIHQFISFGGIGVDLFFVISGFCMYLMHSKNASHFTGALYGNFIKKRWFRIAPAFYFVVLFESLKILYSLGSFPTKSFIYHLVFLNTFNNDNVLSPPLWSLATEWHFYLILPFLFISDPLGKYLNVRVIGLMTVCLILRLWLYHGYDLTSGITVPNDKIWYRFVEFGFGILAARFYIQKRSLPFVFRGNIGFMLSFLLAFSGRLCMATAILAHFGKFSFIIRAFGEPILTCGFALMILNLVDTDSIFKRLISAKPIVFLGKISYSMYLWHWMIASWISFSWIARGGVSIINQELAFVVSVLCCIPIAMISYRLFEAPYFKQRPKAIDMEIPREGLNLMNGLRK